MIKLLIILVLSVNIINIHSRCYRPLVSYGRAFSHHQYAKYECAPHYRCYDQYYELTHEDKQVIESSQCKIFEHICCRHLNPPPLSSATQPRPQSVSQQFPWREPVRNTLPSRPQSGGQRDPLPNPWPSESSSWTWLRPSRRPSSDSEPEPPRPTQIFPHGPIWESSPYYDPPSLSHVSPSNSDCQCKSSHECNDKRFRDNVYILVGDQNYIGLGQSRCTAPNDVCCYDPDKPLPHHSQEPSQISPQNPIRIPSLHPLKPSSTPSSSEECTCTPFFRCYDEETSSNLTALVDDRIHIPTIPESEPNVCPNPNDICCYNLVRSPDPNLSVQSQSSSPPQASPQNTIANSSSPGSQLQSPSQTFSDREFRRISPQFESTKREPGIQDQQGVTTVYLV